LAKEPRPAKTKSDTCGHPTSSRTWNSKSVCAHIFTERISDEQKNLSDNGEKDISNYHPALTKIFEELDEEEMKQCEDLAVEWNTSALPDDVQRKWVINLITT
jgi:hypothetical protein